MKLAVIYTAVLSLCARNGVCTKTRLVCEQLDDICNEGPQSDVIPEGVTQGRPGKRGAIGPKGAVGPPGPPGPINEEAVRSVQNTISQERRKTDEIVESMKRRLLHLEETFIPRALIETCDFFYKSKCYFLLMPASRVNRPEVRALCRQQGGDMADIVDRIHFGKAVDLIRSKTFIAHSYNHVWTGMNVDVQARRIRLKNGEWAPYQRWYPNRPYTPARVAVGIHADYITYSSNTGMFDEHDTIKLLGGLCEKNVN